MNKAILFDNDGTLSDSVPAVIHATNTVLKNRGYAPNTDEEIIDGMRINTLDRMLKHTGENDKQIGFSLAKDFYKALNRELEGIRFFDGIRESLDLLSKKDYILGVVSNNLSRVVDMVLSWNGVRSLFSVILGEDNAEEPKPGSGGLLQACRILGVTPGNCVYIGDSLSDALAADRAGITSFGVKWNHHDMTDIDSLGFTHTLDIPEEIPAAVSSFFATKSEVL